MASQHHESFIERHQAKGSSDRSFGLVFAGFFLLVALSPLAHGRPLRVWAALLAGCFLAAALVGPSLLAPLNRTWQRLGRLIQRVVSPVMLGLIYFLVLTPMALVMRRLGKDPLQLRFAPEQASYWIDRVPPGPPPESLRRQF